MSHLSHVEIGGCQAGAVCRGAEFICTSVLIENKGLWKSCIGACSALCMCFMWRCWCSSFPSRCKVCGAGSAGRCRVRLLRCAGAQGGTRETPAYIGCQEELGKKKRMSVSRHTGKKPAERFSFCVLNARVAWCGTVVEPGPAGSGVLRGWAG